MTKFSVILVAVGVLAAAIAASTGLWPGGRAMLAHFGLTAAPGGSDAPKQIADANKTPATRPIAVEAAQAASAKTTMDLRAVGSLQSDESVQIASEIAGRITELPLKEGEPVKEGAILVRLDDALVKAEVADAQARLDLAEGNLDRANSLARTGNVTGRAKDEATANAETARAAVELSKVRLSKHTISAPFPGVVGLRKASVGAFVAVGQAIVNLEKIDMLKVDFKLPELVLTQVKVGQAVELTVDAIPKRTFTGRVYAIDPLVDVNGRALQLRARVDNADGVLRPGLFARIVLKGLSERDVVVVPESAIVPRGSEALVYVIAENKAVETKVRLGQRKDGRVEVVEGLKPDAQVVTAGQQKLRNGAPVEVVPPAKAAVIRSGS